MKIAIITLNDNNNYGNRLQNYALEKFLKSNFLVEVDTIWYDEKSLYKSTINLWSWKSLIKYIFNKGNFRRYIKDFYINDCIRMYNIEKFTKKIKTKLDFYLKDNISNEYDYFIVGSDQVWNPFFWFKDNQRKARLLLFTIREKKIAYSASFGISNIPESYKKIFKEALNDIRSISVREKAGSEIIEKLIGKKVPVLVDPTILLYKEEWQNIKMVPEWYNGERYILTYFLGNSSPVIEKIAKKNNWKICNLMDKNNFDLYTSRVEEFIYLINHAQLVVTDSFHACVFSILMNTPFLVVNRQEKGMADMTSRIDTLMELFGYQDRYIINGKCELSEKDILHMDFSNVKDVQKREIKRSTAYMKKALNLE